MRNFVILYTGHEGSSALVSMLRKHPQVSIPVFEDLDRPNFCQHFERDRVAEVIEHYLSTGSYPAAIEEVAARDPDSPRPTRSIGFKWRVFTAPGIVEALLRCDAVVFMLMRRNVLRRALSVYFSHDHLRRPHLQFEISKLDDDARRERVAELRNQHFAADIQAVADLITKTTRHKDAQRTLVSTPLRRAGGTVQPLFYEDLLGDSVTLLNTMLRRIGCTERDAPLESFYKKVNRDQIEEQVTNLADLLAHEPTRTAIRDYDALVDEILAETSR